MQKVDFHTHLIKNDPSLQVLNIFAQDLPLPVDENFYSAGLHPWHIGMGNPDGCLEALEMTAGKTNLLAIGECGLDRSIDTNFARQEWYFRKQIEMAQKHSKPLIIHCVRAFPEMIKLKKEYHSSIPWILHGFTANQQTTKELVRHNFYFSVGYSLLNNEKKKEIFLLIPSDRLFLETDDREISISSIYTLAAQILKVDEKALIANILENFRRLFGR